MSLTAGVHGHYYPVSGAFLAGESRHYIVIGHTDLHVVIKVKLKEFFNFEHLGTEIWCVWRSNLGVYSLYHLIKLHTLSNLKTKNIKKREKNRDRNIQQVQVRRCHPIYMM